MLAGRGCDLIGEGFLRICRVSRQSFVCENLEGISWYLEDHPN